MYKVSVYDVLHNLVGTFTVTGYTTAIHKINEDYSRCSFYDIRKVNRV